MLKHVVLVQMLSYLTAKETPLWFVDTPDEMRFARAERTLNLSRDEVQRREVAQSPLDRKRARADFVIDNSGAPETLTAQVVAGLRA